MWVSDRAISRASNRRMKSSTLLERRAVRAAIDWMVARVFLTLWFSSLICRRLRCSRVARAAKAWRRSVTSVTTPASLIGRPERERISRPRSSSHRPLSWI
ncbi:hypothetical protein D3C81_1702630 [compost metagenome]